jgi:hypothetical protein
MRKIISKTVGSTAGAYVGRTGEVFYDPSTTSLRISDGTTAGGLPIGGTSTAVHGCFHKVADVVATQANTAFSFDWFTDVTQHVGDAGVTVTAGQPTRLNISTAGNYLTTLEMLVKTEGNAPRDVFLWLSKNGTDIAETGVKVEVRQGSVGTPVYEFISKQWLLHDIAANDYIELRFAVSRIDLMSLEYSPAQTTPYVRPAIPSAVITVAQI